MNKKGIDVSHWQGNIDFEKVKAAGIDFVILKAGGWENRFYKDPNFETNYKKAKAAGLNVGAYYFVGKFFTSKEVGNICAKNFLELIRGLQFEYPVFLDIEAQDNRYREGITAAAIAFCDHMEKAGYFTGIYASDISGFKDKLIHEDIKKYAHWVARYGSDPKICTEYQIHQYTSKGNVDGIIGSVDMDISKVDYPSIMKEKGLNGFEAQTKKSKRKKSED